MDGVSSASSIIAVVELSAKVASLLLQYSTAVKNARDDIQRLLRQLEPLSATLEEVRKLLDGPGSAKLETIQRFRDQLEGCSLQLKELETRLTETLCGKEKHDSRSARLMSRFGIRALRWPFESKEVDVVIRSLERYRDSLAAALMVQTVQILSTAQDDILSKLPNVASAAFDSHANEHNALCHPHTRVEILREIHEWADNPGGQCIYWLNGMAGTGKSTISRTVAKLFSDENYLCGNFFFKRGERDRGNASQLFTSIASQLVAKEPKLTTTVGAALEKDPTLTSKSLQEQFWQLILKPVESLNDARTLVLVIDALDECEHDDDVRLIIHLISKGSQLRSMRVRAFLTSRPELPIRLGFNAIRGSYQDLVLHQLPSQVIQVDISHFLNSELCKIREEYNSLFPGTPLPSDWPGPEIVQELARMAMPLFVFAATACRFISDPAWSDPDGQLKKVLEYRSEDKISELGNLDATYRPVLDRLVVGSQTAQRSLIEEFRLVVGSIILLEEPLSAFSLSQLLDISKPIIDRRLVSLHSVLHIPATDDPIRLLHLSFREFLVDPQKRHTNQFWVDEEATHKRLGLSCLKLLSSHPHFHKDSCRLEHPGTARADVPASVISSTFPTQVRYACIYWVDHVVKSGTYMTDDHEVYAFLQRHFLHWLEALSLLDKLPESASMARKLQSIINVSISHHQKESNKASLTKQIKNNRESIGIAAFLHDAVRFISTFKFIITKSPLQTYSSALVFSPETSVIRNMFQDDLPKWIRRLPPVQKRWNDCLHTLEGHTGGVWRVLFAPDGRTILSSSSSDKVRSWDSHIGTENEVNRIDLSHFWDLSPDGKTLLSVSNSTKQIFLSDTVTGEEIQAFSIEQEIIKHSLRFTPNGQNIFFLEWNGLVRILSINNGEEVLRLILGNNKPYVLDAALSPDQSVIASNMSETLNIWDVKTGKELLVIDAHHERIRSITFSPNGQRVATAHEDGIVCIWDRFSGTEQLRIQTHGGNSMWQFVVFAPDGKTFATNSDRTVRLWDAQTGSQIKALDGHYQTIACLAFSPDGKRIASGAIDGTIRIWDATGDGAEHETQESGPWGTAFAMCFSSDGQNLQTIRRQSNGFFFTTTDIWGSVIDDAKLMSYRKSITGLTGFFPYSERFAFTFPPQDGIWVFDKKTATNIFLPECDVQFHRNLAISSDGSFLVTISKDKIIELWNILSGNKKQTLELESHLIGNFTPRYPAISANGRIITFVCKDMVSVCTWDILTGEIKDVTPRDPERVWGLAVSSCAQRIAALCVGDEYCVKIWDAIEGAQAQILLKLGDDSIGFISFTPDDQYLWTDCGFICLNMDPAGSSMEQSSQKMPLFMDNDWITRAGMETLWIPPDYRPDIYAVNIDTIVLVRDGNWMTIQFSF
ncbi:hypothetical protein Plec18170_001118 [Paecilomyces lecythidis]